MAKGYVPIFFKLMADIQGATDEAIKQDLCPSCEKELIRWLKKGGKLDAP